MLREKVLVSDEVMETWRSLLRGSPRRLGGRKPGLGRPAWKRDAVRSVAGFCFGLFLASVYGMTALLVQNHDLWFCVYSTVAIAFLAAFGMAFSVRVRANVMLMLPMLCSTKGKNLLLFLAFSMVVQGPVTNTLENFGRAADSVVCGAELAMNQTRELMERAASPLLPVLGQIREITRNAHSVAGRVQNLIKALTESVRHIARTLRNVLHFLASIGEVCNDKLGTPYRKCNKVFDDARGDCMELLSVFNFLCHIVDAFRPLCGIAHGQLFCVIPSYVAEHMRTRLAAPTVAAFERMKQEFEFNVSAVVDVSVDVSSSQSLQQASQAILEEVSQELGRVRELTGLLAYGGLLLLATMYLQAALYKHRYLQQDDFDNCYITEQLEQLDRRMSRRGRPSVLPLSQREARSYTRPGSLSLTPRERGAAALGALSMLRHVIMAGLLVLLDLLVFWTLDLVHHHAQGDVVARAPITVAVQVDGTGYASDIFKDLVASFDVLQKGNITILSKKCLIHPSEPDYSGYVLIGFLYGLSLFTVVAGSYVRRLRSLVCASYHPRREQERAQLLLSAIQRRRRSLGEALLRSVARSRADAAEEETSLGLGLLHTLALRVPGGSYLGGLLGVASVTCMACGGAGKGGGGDDIVTCSTPQCKGSYCGPCFRCMNNVCAVCMGPLTFQEDGEEELDSSDGEQLGLWTAALASPHVTRRRTRKLMKRRISAATRRRSLAPVAPESRVPWEGPPWEGSSVPPTGTLSGDSDSSGHISPPSDSDLSEPDMTYQDHPEPDRSDLHPGHSDPSPTPALSDVFVSGGPGRPLTSDSDASDSDASSAASERSQEGPLRTVTVHGSGTSLGPAAPTHPDTPRKSSV